MNLESKKLELEKKNQELVEQTAERLAGVLIMQIEEKKKSKKKR